MLFTCACLSLPSFSHRRHHHYLYRRFLLLQLGLKLLRLLWLLQLSSSTLSFTPSGFFLRGLRSPFSDVLLLFLITVSYPTSDYLAGLGCPTLAFITHFGIALSTRSIRFCFVRRSSTIQKSSLVRSRNFFKAHFLRSSLNLHELNNPVASVTAPHLIVEK